MPVSAAMLFIPVTLLVLHTMGEKSRGKSLWVLLLLIGGTIFVHPTTEVVVTALAVMFLAAFIGEALARGRYGEGLGLLLAAGVRIAIPAVVLGLWLPKLSKSVLEQAAAGGSGRVSLIGLQTGFPEAFGVLAVALSILGLFVFIARGEFGVRSYILPLFMCLLVVFLLFFFPRYNLGSEVLYGRAWLYLGLFMVILAGYGVAFYFRSIPAIAHSVASRFPRPLGALTAGVLWAMGTAMVVAALVTGIVTNEERQDYAGYYHIVDQAIFADFRWMGQHTAPEQSVALGEPSMAWSYPPIAGPGAKVFQAVAAPWTNQRANKVRQMLTSGEADVPWLQKAGVSVFYACRPQTFTCVELTNTDLFKVRRGVYLIPDPPDKR